MCNQLLANPCLSDRLCLHAMATHVGRSLLTEEVGVAQSESLHIEELRDSTCIVGSGDESCCPPRRAAVVV